MNIEMELIEPLYPKYKRKTVIHNLSVLRDLIERYGFKCTVNIWTILVHDTDNKEVFTFSYKPY